MRRAAALKRAGAPDEVIDFCRARAYTRDDGFYHYCKEVVGLADLVPHFHEKIAKFTVLRLKRGSTFKMLQACRGSYKSSIVALGYATWRIAREYHETGESRIRILFASEILGLAKRNLAWCKQTLEWNRTWKQLFGDHRGERGWTDYQITSAYRKDATIGEPTISLLGITADRTGMHYDLIIADDLEAERTSASVETINKVWDYFRLFYSLLDPASELYIVSTRWHYDDIYARILAQPNNKFKTLIVPARNKKGKPTFPEKYGEAELSRLRDQQGPYIFSCQYLLDPVPESERTFKEAWICYTKPEMFEKPNLLPITAADFAYSTERDINANNPDPSYTAIITVYMDEEWNYIFVDHFRERCDIMTGIQELYRQYYEYASICSALQRFDKSNIEQVIEQQGFLLGQSMNIEWISYPSRENKKARIISSIQPLMKKGKIFLLPDMKWFEDELLEFPRGAHWDGLDALCNIVRVALPSLPHSPKTLDTPTMRRIKLLKAGLYDPEGEKTWKNI